MIIAGLQKLSLLDFPGKMCCTVFTQGCNLRCPFCHNSDLIHTGKADCPVTEEEFFSFLNKRKSVLEGVTVSGGEPLLQQDISEFIGKIKKIGYLVKLDTNGFFPDKLKELIDSGLVDYVAMDIKSSQEGYGKAAGASIKDITPVLRSVELLKSGVVPYEFRTTLVDELHSEKELRAIAEWLDGAKKYCLQSFRDSDGVAVSGLHACSPEKIEHFAQLFNSKVKELIIR